VLLCSNNGYMWFGGYDPSYASGTPQYVPLSCDPTTTSECYWNVSITDMSLGSTDIGGADDQATVDTGTAVFYMQSSAYDSLVSALSSNSGATSVFGSGALSSNFFNQGNCISPTGGQTQAQIDSALPPLNITFAGSGGANVTLSLPATESYLLPVGSGSSTQYCGAVGSGGSQSGSTIYGDAVMRANLTIFDEGNQQIGFIPNTYCQ